MVKEGTSLKKDFKQKENKYLEEFLDMKALKEKVEDKLYKQDQSLQTVHMLCKPNPYYDEHNKVAIGYKNPLCLTRAKQVQPALYNGYEIIKTNHVLAIVHNTEDALEIAEITRKKINDKMKDPEFSRSHQDESRSSQKADTASRPIKALTVYPSNTPAMLVPRMLPTKIQALTKEIKEIKDIFEELEAKVDQNAINRKHAKIERKNILIANDNLIANCLSKDVFYIATNSELTVSRFTEMHDAHTIVQVRCLELEVELSNLRDKVQKDDHTELVKRFSNLEITRAKHMEQTTSLITKNENLKAQILNKMKCVTKDHVKPTVLAPGVNCCTYASRSQPRSKTKKNRISPAKGVNKKKVEEHPRTNKSNLRTTNRVDSSRSSKRTVIRIVLWYLDLGCSKHMTGDLSRLMNFVKKFIGTVRFWNDHFGAIMGYGDYVIGNSVISRVYYVEGRHNLFSIVQFCDSDMEVAFRKHSCYVRDTDGVEIIKGSHGSNLYTISVEDMMNSSPICLLSKASKNKSW
ncbi:hypothetical protein Tco_1365867, partial [Tanacetum coccineum]